MTVAELIAFLDQYPLRTDEVRVYTETGVCLPAEVEQARFWERASDGNFHEVLKVVLKGKWPRGGE